MKLVESQELENILCGILYLLCGKRENHLRVKKHADEKRRNWPQFLIPSRMFLAHSGHPHSLFGAVEVDFRREELMAAMGAVNSRFGRAFCTLAR